MISLIIPTNHKSLSSSFLNKNHQNKTIFFTNKRRKFIKKHNQVPVARLFGPSVFEASKLKVLFLGGADEQKHNNEYLPRTYTLTHSDITSKLTLAISQTINNSQLQGWSNKLYRDEVVAEWRKMKGKMSLHVHCHISGGHFLLDMFARLRFFIFTKELPLVLKAIAHGDGNLLKNYPELEEATVWVYFHSNIQEFNKVECWGPLKDAVGPLSTSSSTSSGSTIVEGESVNWEVPKPCLEDCSCCFPPMSSIPWSHDFVKNQDDDAGSLHNGSQQKA